MSVYTPISQNQLENYLTQYSVGSLIHFSGIQAGIENTNYRIKTSSGHFILTIFETLTAEELSCYLQLISHLEQLNFPAPKPYLCNTQQFINPLAGKPATLFSCLPGRSIEHPSTAQCFEIGQYLATLHLLGSSSNFNQQNSKNINGCQQVFNTIEPFLSKQHTALLSSELNYQSCYTLPDLPKGIIHGDLFKDNVLFNHGKITGILDFYNACSDYLLFDIAITCNDWCVENGTVKQQQMSALLSGYQSIRALTDNEKMHLTVFFRLAALRFYLSRLEHQLNPKQGELTLEKDPMVFKHLLETYRTKDVIL